MDARTPSHHKTQDLLSVETKRNGVPLRSALARLFITDNNRVSVPKFLFMIALIDGVLTTGFGIASGILLGHGKTSDIGLVIFSVVVGFALVVTLGKFWSYSIFALRNPSRQISKAFSSTAIVMMFAAGFSHAAHWDVMPPMATLLWVATTLASLSVVRLICANIVRNLGRAGYLRRRTVVIGSGPDVEELVTSLQKQEPDSLEFLGFFDDRDGERSSTSVGNVGRLGTFHELAGWCRTNHVDLAVVAVPPRAERRILEILQDLFELNLDVRISAQNSHLRLNPNAYRYVGNVPFLAIMDKPLGDWDRTVKNFTDLILGVLILLLAAPVMAVVALAVRLESKGPIFFRQRRYGFDNKLIEVYKFRSMYVDKLDASAEKLVTKGDPRVTRVGRFIRKTSLDELPQLFNVIKGEMSLVGPRPHATQAKAGDDLYEKVVQNYMARHRVKPGVTGWAQVCGWRGETDTQEKIQRRVACDLYYIDNWSVLFDLKILAMTPTAMLSGKNAY